MVAKRQLQTTNNHSPLPNNKNHHKNNKISSTKTNQRRFSIMSSNNDKSLQISSLYPCSSSSSFINQKYQKSSKNPLIKSIMDNNKNNVIFRLKIPLTIAFFILSSVFFASTTTTKKLSLISQTLSMAPEATRRLLTEYPLTDDEDGQDHWKGSKIDYTNHSIIKIANRDIGLLFPEEDGVIGGDVDDNHEILWYDHSDRNSTGPNAQYAFVRIGPKRLNRVKRDLRYLSERPVFVTNNLQSWLDAEHQPYHRPLKNNFVISKSVTDDDGMLDEEEDGEDEPVYSVTSRVQQHPVTGYPAHHSKIVPSFILNRYQPLSQVNRFMKDVAMKFPGHVTVFTIGYSHENRPIQAIEILNNPNDPNFMWIDGCTHAREWVTVTTALYAIEQAIVSKIPVNFIIVPVLNVDGYVFTWTNDRMWRKNRRPYHGSRLARSSMPDRCTGVDLNRNYDINFGGTGSSKNPCSVLYQGPYPFSEPEVRAARDLLSNNRHRIKMTLSLHSFNQLWSCPNAFTDERTKDYDHHMRVLKSIQKAVHATNGVLYDIGPLGSRLYFGSGFMMDWIYHKLKIRDAYLVELRDRGFYGFILPADQIWPTATETWQGIRAAIQHVFL